MTKKLFATLASLALLAGACAMPVSAENDCIVPVQEECKGDPGYGICHVSYEQQLQAILERTDLTLQQKKAATIAINEAIQMRETQNDAKASIMRTSYSTITISLTPYTQEESYYCGPATARQTLEYLGRIVPGGYNPMPQPVIAEEIHTTTDGTEWNYLVNYINSFVFMNTPHTYIEHPLGTLAGMETIIYNSLAQSRPEPPILQINTNGDSSALGYSTAGHYMNVSGIRTENGVNEFQVTDPNRKRKNPAWDPKIWVSTSVIYTYTDNHWASHFMC